MKPVRVKLRSSWEVPEPDYEREFIGKTGTVVWATKGGWGDYQCSVELDIPHSQFGKFCNIAYWSIIGRDRKNQIILDLIDGSSGKDIRNLAHVQNENWRRYRTPNGDPKSWSEVGKLLDEEEKRNE